MHFSPINPPSHEILCRPGLVGPKISFSLEETGVSWSESSNVLRDRLVASKMDHLIPTILHCKSGLGSITLESNRLNYNYIAPKM